MEIREHLHDAVGNWTTNLGLLSRHCVVETHTVVVLLSGIYIYS